MSPLVSVVIPTRNRAHLLGRALRSALDQTLLDFEIIVVDDASSDDLRHVVEELGDPRIRFIRLPEQGGAGRARNAGIRVAHAEVIAFLDSDDEWLPSMLERQIACLHQSRDPSRTVVYCLYQRRDALTGRTVPSRRATPQGPGFERLLTGWNTPSSTVLVGRSFLLAVGGFDESLPASEDYDLWLRLAQASAHFAPVRETHVILHHHQGPQLSADPEARLRALQIFDARWGPVVRTRIGARGYRRWRARHSAAVQKSRFMRVREMVARGERKAAWGEWRAMLRPPASAHRYLVQAALLLGFGATVYGALARIENAAFHARVAGRGQDRE